MEQTITTWLTTHGLSLVWSALLAVIAVRLGNVAVELAREQIAKIQSERWRALAYDIVTAIEQTMTGETGIVKREAALKKLTNASMPLTAAKVLVESAVYEMNADKVGELLPARLGTFEGGGAAAL